MADGVAMVDIEDSAGRVFRLLDSHPLLIDLKAGSLGIVIRSAEMRPDLVGTLRRHRKVAKVIVILAEEEMEAWAGLDAILINRETGAVTGPGRIPRRILVLAPFHGFGRFYAVRVFLHGARSIFLWDGFRWSRISLPRFIIGGVLAWLSQPPLIWPETNENTLTLRWAFMLRQLLGRLKILRRAVQKLAESQASLSMRRLRNFLQGREPRGDFVPKRIVLANNSLVAGGAERQFVNTAVGLRSAGFSDVLVLHLGKTQRSGGLDPDFYLKGLREQGVAAGVVAEREQALGLEGSSGFMKDRIYGVLKDLPFEIRSHVVNHYIKFRHLRPEVVHLWLDYTAVTAGIAAVLAGVPKIVLSARNLAPYNFELWRPWMRPGYEELMKNANVQMLVNSAAGAESYEHWLDLHRGSTRVLYNGFDSGFVESAMADDIAKLRREFGLRENAGDHIVGGVFRFWPEKDPLLWIAVAGEIARQNPQVRFLLVGDGIMRSAMESAATRLGIEEKIIWAGSRKDVGAIMRLFNVMLLTSHAEGLPNVLLEAQALGVPVVVTEGGGSAEAMSDGETGVLIRNRDPASIAQEVLAFIESPERRQRAARRGPEFIEEKFAMRKMIDETIDVYFGGRASSLPGQETSSSRGADGA